MGARYRSQAKATLEVAKEKPNRCQKQIGRQSIEEASAQRVNGLPKSVYTDRPQNGQEDTLSDPLDRVGSGHALADRKPAAIREYEDSQSSCKCHRKCFGPLRATKGV